MIFTSRTVPELDVCDIREACVGHRNATFREYERPGRHASVTRNVHPTVWPAGARCIPDI